MLISTSVVLSGLTKEKTNETGQTKLTIINRSLCIKQVSTLKQSYQAECCCFDSFPLFLVLQQVSSRNFHCTRTLRQALSQYRQLVRVQGYKVQKPHASHCAFLPNNMLTEQVALIDYSSIHKGYYRVALRYKSSLRGKNSIL